MRWNDNNSSVEAIRFLVQQFHFVPWMSYPMRWLTQNKFPYAKRRKCVIKSSSCLLNASHCCFSSRKFRIHVLGERSLFAVYERFVFIWFSTRFGYSFQVFLGQPVSIRLYRRFGTLSTLTSSVLFISNINIFNLSRNKKIHIQVQINMKTTTKTHKKGRRHGNSEHRKWKISLGYLILPKDISRKANTRNNSHSDCHNEW